MAHFYSLNSYTSSVAAFALSMSFAINVWSASPDVTLDCQNVGDAPEAQICADAKASSCEKAAEIGVLRMAGLRGNKEFELNSVSAEQEDAIYDVHYSAKGSLALVAFSAKVFVSIVGDTCEISQIQQP